MPDWHKEIESPPSTPPKPSVLRADPSLSSPLEVTVVHTDALSTLRAIEKVVHLVAGLAAGIRLLVLQVVPYPLPIEEPDVPLEFTRKLLMEMLPPTSLDVRVDIRVGRDTNVMLESAFAPASLIVVGSRRRWWPTPENRIAKRLQRLGHHVIAKDAK